MKASLQTNFQRLRIKLGYPIGAFAQELDISVNTIASIENKRRSIPVKTLNFIKHAWGIDPEWLLRDDLSQPVPEIHLNPQANSVEREIRAMKSFCDILQPLEKPAQERVLKWINNRFNDNNHGNGS